jgi:hypothetical protein
VSHDHDDVVLTLVGLSEDQSALVMADEDGQTFRIPVDDATSVIASRSPARIASRYAAAADAGRAARTENSMDQMRPRDIQARIRAGAAIDDVVAESGMDRDRIERYAGPMLAERAHVADLARDTEIRRDMASDVPLVRAVAERLTPMGVEDSSAAWDSWRREDGRWVVRIAYAIGRDERSGHWVFDPRARSLVADDAEARWLIDPAAPEPHDDERATKRRLAPVVALGAAAADDTDIDEPAPAIALVAVADDTDLEATSPEAALIGAQVDAALAEYERTDDLTAEADDALEELEHDAPSDLVDLTEQVQATLDELDEYDDATGEESQDAPASAPAPKPAKRKGRASVPSWDDIVFGSRRND